MTIAAEVFIPSGGWYVANASVKVTTESGTNHLVVLRDSGVVGTALAQGDTLLPNGPLPYQFSLAPGFRNLIVLLDGRRVPTMGTIPMDSGRVLIVSADRIPLVSPDLQPLSHRLRDVLTSSDPVSAYQRYLNGVVAYADQYDTPDLDNRLEEMEAATVDPIGDAAAIRRVDQALGGREFPLDLASTVLVSRATQASPLFNRQAAPNTTPNAVPRRDLLTDGGPWAEPTTVRYVNGIWNSGAAAIRSTRDLKQLIQRVPEFADAMARNTLRVTHFYNRNVKAQINDRCVAELASRKRWLGIAGGVVFYQACVAQTPFQFIWEADLLESARQLVDNENWLGLQGTDLLQVADVQSLADAIYADQAQGRHQILVPHSQGNLLVQQAINRLVRDGRYNSMVDSSCLGVVSLAAPTSNGWTHTPSDQLKLIAVRSDLVADLRNSAAPRFTNTRTAAMDASMERLERLLAVPVSVPGGTALRAVVDARRVLWRLNVHEVASYFQPGPRDQILKGLRNVYRACAVSSVSATPGYVFDADSGYTYVVSPTLRNTFGRDLPGRLLTWRLFDPMVASVQALSPSGIIKTTGPGATQVIGQTSGGRVVSVPVSVRAASTAP